MCWSRLTVLLLFLTVAESSQVLASEFVVIVKGGDQFAKHVPVRIAVPDDVKPGFVSLSGNGNYLLGQIEASSLLSSGQHELTFVLPDIEAGEEFKMIGKTIAEEEASPRLPHRGKGTHARHSLRRSPDSAMHV